MSICRSVTFVPFCVALWFASSATAQELPSDNLGKLVRAEDVVAELQSGVTRLELTVQLTAGKEITGFADWSDLDARTENRRRIAALQTRVINSWPAEELSVVHRFENQPSLYVNATRFGLALLLDDPSVGSVTPVIEVQAGTRQGIPLMSADRVRWATGGGAGVSIAVCDTGIDYTHPDLGGGAFPNAKVIGGFDFGDNDPDPLPGLFIGGEHGTAVAGIAAGNLPDPSASVSSGDYIGGMAHGARLYALKLTPGLSGTSNTGVIAMSWDWCVTNQFNDPQAPILVINTSFGSGQFFGNCDLLDPVAATSANIAKAAGISIVCCSGNDGYCDAMWAPACLSSTIAVGAVYDNAIHQATHCVEPASCVGSPGGCSTTTGFTCEDNVVAAGSVTCYSNSSSELDLVAPADRAYTTDISGVGGVSPDDYENDFIGTSAAAPYVAGAIAMMQSAAASLLGSYLTPDDALDALMSTGVPVLDPKSGVTASLPDVEAAITTFSPRWGLNDPSTDLMLLAQGDVYADSCTGGKFPLVFEQDTKTSNSFFLLDGAFVGRLPKCRADDDPPPAAYTSSDAFQRADVFGFGTPFLTLRWRSKTMSRTLEDDWDADANGSLAVDIAAEILPSASTPPGTPLTLMTLVNNKTYNNVQPENVDEDEGNITFDLDIDATDIDAGFYNIPTFSAPFNTISRELKDQVTGLTGYAVGDTVGVDLDIATDVVIRWPGKPTAPNFLHKDTIDAGAIGSIIISLIGPPSGSPLPLPPPVLPISPNAVPAEFSVDIGGDTELSDFAPDGNETFDAGDAYPWNGPPLPLGGADGSLDDDIFFGGLDPAPDPLIGILSAPPTCQPLPLFPDAFDLSGLDRVDVSFVPLLPPGTLGPIARFPSGCIPRADRLLLSFDEDDEFPYAGGAFCSTPLGSFTPNGSEVHGDEVTIVEIVPGIPTVFIDEAPLLHEGKVHPNLQPSPELGPSENDDVDALVAKPIGSTCNLIHFTVDHEASGPSGLTPGFVYEYDPATGLVATIVDPGFHLGLSFGTEVDSIAWSFFQDLNPPMGSLYSGLDGLLLLFSVNRDDPLSVGVDESGGLQPDAIYASYLDGSHFVLLPHVSHGLSVGANVDAIAAVDGDIRDGDYQFRYASTLLQVGFDPTTGVGGGAIQVDIVEDTRAPGFPNATLGFTMSIAHDPALLVGSSVALAGAVDALVQSSVGFFNPQILPDLITIDVIYDPNGGATLNFATLTPAVTISYQTNAASLQGISFPLQSTLEWSHAAGVFNHVLTPSGQILHARVDDVPVSLLPVTAVCFRRGDCNDDGQVNIGDAIAILTVLFFSGAPQPGCDSACDMNGNGVFNITDPVHLLSFLFGMGPPPPAPFPNCGTMPGAICGSFQSCPPICP